MSRSRVGTAGARESDPDGRERAPEVPAAALETSPEASLEALVQRGYRYALSLCHDRERAADLVQDACLGVSRRGGPWEMAYLVRAIRNRHIDLHRRRGVREGRLRARLAAAREQKGGRDAAGEEARQ